MGKYLEKDFLCKYDLSKEFFDYIGLEVVEATPLRKVFVIQSDKGEKILKRVEYDENKIKFIEKSLEFINKTFENTMKINKLKNGQSYVKWNGEYYIVMDRLRGNEGIYTSPLDVEVCTEAIRRFHKASKGLTSYLKENETMVIKSEPIDEMYENAYKDMEKIEEWVQGYKNPNEFDKLFLENVKEYKTSIKECIEKLKKTKYKKLVEDEEYLVLCHNDLAHHNFLIEEEKGKIIDFDYASINLRAVDVADFILKWIKNSTFDIEKARGIIENYNREKPLTREEIELIKIFLTFPRDVYSIIRVYYHKEKTWNYESYLNKFRNKLNGDVYRRNFLKEYNL